MTSQTNGTDPAAQTRLEERGLLWKETLGHMALGFVHECNNLLTGILSVSDTYLEQTDPAQTVHAGLALIKENARQASQLVQHLGNLYHLQCGPPSYQDLNAATAETLVLLRRVISKRLELVSELIPGPLPVYVDAVHLRQAIIALALDAALALTRRGKIIFQTARQDRRVCLAISAAAPKTGAAPNAWRSIQPDAPGLTQARQFAAKHQGVLMVDLPNDQPTATFRLWLPESDFTEAG